MSIDPVARIVAIAAAAILASAAELAISTSHGIPRPG
ncbi:hypothetical protein X011_09555 [Mycobacterium tuberculosis variant microti OV254]|nr:hypothetical protein X011_09555 [Mycobacterium tuberculosis variant microti OV254]